MEKSEIMKIISELTAENDANAENLTKSSNFEEILSEKSSLVRRNHDTYCPSSQDTSENATVTYINLLAAALENLTKTLNEYSKTEDGSILISVKELNLILRGVEFLVAIGVRSCLEFEIACLPNSQTFALNFDEATKEILLDKSLACLLELCKCQAVQSNIISKYLNFIITGCLQMAWNPKLDRYHAKYRLNLQEIFDLVYRPFVLKEFLILQRGRSPGWLKKVSSSYLSKFLLDANGLYYFLQVVKDLGTNFDDFLVCESYANLLVTPPQTFKNRRNEYFERIFDQFWTVFRSCRRNSGSKLADYGYFFVFFARKLFSIDVIIFRRLFLKNLQLPLIQIESSDVENYPADRILTECIENIHYFLCNGPSDVDFAKNFIDFCPTFIHIYANLDGSVSFCNNLSKEVIVSLFSCLDSSEFVGISKYFLSRNSLWHFFVSADGGVGVRKASDDEKNDSDSKILTLIRLLDILTEEIRTKFACELVLDCLKRLNFAENDLNYVEKVSNFFEIDEKIRLIEENLLNLSLLTSLIDRFGENLTRDSEKIIDLCEVIFENNSKPNEEIPDEIKNQTLITCLGLISLILLNGDDTNSIENLIPRVINRLKTLSESYPNAELRETAKNLLSSIDLSAVKSIDPCKNSFSESIPTKKQPWQPKKPTYDECLCDINDSLLPVRAHGIISMSTLLKTKDPCAISNVDALLSIFLENIENEDSYVFLAAINAIVAVAEIKTKTALDSLLAKFSDYSNQSIENQLKIGEATVKISRILGDIAPHYCTQIVNKFLSMMKNDDEIVRASCLSNVGEISSLASFKITECLHELVFAVDQLLKHDKNDLVRRGAIDLLRRILVGTSQRMLEIFGDEMKNVYRLVKHLHVDDRDDVVRLHAQICIEIIDEYMKNASTSMTSGQFSIRNIQI